MVFKREKKSEILFEIYPRYIFLLKVLNNHKETLVRELLLLSPTILTEETLMIEVFFSHQGKKQANILKICDLKQALSSLHKANLNNLTLPSSTKVIFSISNYKVIIQYRKIISFIFYGSSISSVPCSTPIKLKPTM